jgi:inner membrane protein
MRAGWNGPRRHGAIKTRPVDLLINRADIGPPRAAGIIPRVHIPTHILSGWCLANLVPATPRQRLAAMLAASLPDLDGVGIVFGQEAYWAMHHVVGHNLVFGVLLSTALAWWCDGKRWLTFALSMVCFHAHLLMDYFGSGPGWAIHYWWPIDGRGYKTELAWELTSWQNRLAFVVVLAWTIVIAIRSKRTPLERIAPRLDARLCHRARSSVDGPAI